MKSRIVQDILPSPATESDSVSHLKTCNAKEGYHSPALWSPCDSVSRTPALESGSR